MRNYLIDFLNKYDFPLDSKEPILNAFDKVNFDEEKLLSILNIYQDKNVDFNSLLTEYHRYIEKIDIHVYEADLILVILLTKKLYELYIREKLSDTLFDNTIIDIKYKVIECHLVKGIWGTFVIEWYPIFFKMQIFGFGKLQYQLTTFGLNYEAFKENDFAISIHIPRTGTKLSKDDINDSLGLMKNHFKNCFKFPLLIKCHSWLLYKTTLKNVNNNSNIAYFAGIFKIIRDDDLPNYQDLWRLFDCEIVDLDCLPFDTSLRRAYINSMRKGETFGEGFGYFLLN